jgi:hypothetical protein
LDTKAIKIFVCAFDGLVLFGDFLFLSGGGALETVDVLACITLDVPLEERDPGDDDQEDEVYTIKMSGHGD